MKILIIKLGALGDVLRTTPLLWELKKKYAGCEVTWVVDFKCQEVLVDNALIDRIIPCSQAPSMSGETFDLAVNLDKEPEALEVLAAVKANKKMGFGRGADGRLSPLDSFSYYAY